MKVRESITKLSVYRVSVYMRDNESLNNLCGNVGAYIRNAVELQPPGLTGYL